jgi:hypothetical protein
MNRSKGQAQLVLGDRSVTLFTKLILGVHEPLQHIVCFALLNKMIACRPTASCYHRPEKFVCLLEALVQFLDLWRSPG